MFNRLDNPKALLPVIVVIITIFTLSGCAVRQEAELPPMPVAAPDSFSDSGQQATVDKWWLSFEDASLNALVDEALLENIALQQAWSRLDQFRALARMSGAMKLPGLDASGSASRARYGEKSFNPSTFSPASTIDSYNLAASVSYQVDLWNQIGATSQAAIFELDAGRKDVESTAIAISSGVVDLWYAILEQRSALELLNSQLQVNLDFLKLVEFRFSQGVGSAMEVYQQRLQVENTRNQLPQTEATLDVLENQLAVLLGRVPTEQEFAADGSLPDVGEVPATGLPVEMLQKRPDIRSAELRFLAADRRLSAAIADRYPKLSISATAGSNANNVGDMLDRWFMNLAGNVLGPIFDGGRRAAEADRNRAVVEERMLAWKQSLLVAIREVEDALATEAGQKKMYAGVREQLTIARSSLDIARNRYLNGLASYLNVLTSLQALQQLERVELQVKRQIISNRIKLYVALGSTWAESLELPEQEVVENHGSYR